MTSTRRAVIVTGALAGTVLLAGCGDDDTRIQDAQEAGPDAAAAILGETVTIEAEVEEVIGPNSFTVGDSQTLVLTETAHPVDVGEQVVARGTVRQLVVPEFEDEFDWISTGTRPWPEEYEQDFVLVADDVEIVE